MASVDQPKCKRRYVDSNGYVRVRDDDGVCGRAGSLVLEHRLVMAKKIGRPLRPDEFVHHIDGNKSNNDPSNLTIVSADIHYRNHKGPVKSKHRFLIQFPPFKGDEEWVKLRCPCCGTIFYRRKAQSFLSERSNTPLTFCKTSCSSKFNKNHADELQNDIERLQNRNLVCEFKTNADFMHVYLLKRGKRDLIDDDGVFHPPMNGYVYIQADGRR